MTLFECLYSYISNLPVAEDLVGGIKPHVLPQRSVFPALVIRQISGPSEPPTHDGPSRWSRPRIEFTVWGNVDKQNEQIALSLMSSFRDFGSAHLHGPNDGYLSVLQVHGPRSAYNPETRLTGIQFDVIGMMNMETLS